MIDRALLDHLERQQVRYCVIGGVALAAHGYARYTADVDLLTMDRRVLDEAFWHGNGRVVEIRRSDADVGDEPVAGLVRWPADPPDDVLVGRGYSMSLAVDTSVVEPSLAAPLATPLALVLLKLEAGGPQHRNDIVALAEAEAALGRFDWGDAVERHLPRLSSSAREGAATPLRTTSHDRAAHRRRAPAHGSEARIRVKEVGDGERRRRYVVCHNPEEETRQREHRRHLVDALKTITCMEAAR